jgi:hypothetical protein
MKTKEKGKKLENEQVRQDNEQEKLWESKRGRRAE